jgi:hypothetical protein
MAKAEISWTRRDEAGEKLSVYARRVGREWRFFTRTRRYECWQSTPNPPLEDWLALLDGIERRVQRRLARPEEPERVRQTIRERFPDAQLP